MSASTMTAWRREASLCFGQERSWTCTMIESIEASRMLIGCLGSGLMTRMMTMGEEALIPI